METGNVRTDGSAGSLDTALLETIFYNEMMLMGDGSSSLSSDFLAYLSSDPTSSLTNNASNIEAAPVDASAIAERALLSDFGVSHANSESGASAHRTSPSPLSSSESAPLAATTTSATVNNSTELPKPVSNQTTTAPLDSTALAQQSSPIPPTPKTIPATTRSPARSASSTLDAPPSASVPQERAKQLVSQFATLASRLGVSLPQNLLQSLVASAAIKEANKTGEETIPTPPSQTPASEITSMNAAPIASPLENPPSSSTVSATEGTSALASSTQMPPSVKEIADTAQAAISAVLETRKRGQPSEPSAVSTNKPLYSKRRKKPRLVDCENKLASLRAENDMLKRHLDNVTNRSNKFLNERKQAEKDLQKLTKEGAGNEKINPVIHKFSEMYSDYGRHRNQELTFHLQQLEKLAAPTNFTKMGLWSLGQNEGFYTNPKQNPIAGILRKELGITPAQGRKIIEQRTKIRNLVGNLNECVMLLGKLNGLCEHKQKVFKDRMTKCQEILTPQQVAKLMLWIDQHSDTLESVCPGWGSERIRGKGNGEKEK